MNKQELNDLANWMRGNYIALRLIGQGLMTTNALRGNQILGIADDMDQHSNDIAAKARNIILDVRIAYLQEDNQVLVVLPDFPHTASGPLLICYTMAGQHDSCSLKYARELPNAEPGAHLEMVKQHFAELYSTFNLIEVDIHGEEFTK